MMGSKLPTIQNSKYGVIIRHKEFIGDISGFNTFTNRVFPINPGIPSTFPWLSQIANSFEEYEFRGLVFQFKSLSSDATLATSTNTGLGSIVMSTNYDSLDPPYVNKMQMENSQFASSAKPSVSQIHPVECARKQTPVTRLYVRSSAPVLGSDIRWHDLGNFQLAVSGMQGTAGGACGELWGSYEVQLFKPKLFDYLGQDDLYYHANITAASAAAGTLGTIGGLPVTIYTGANPLEGNRRTNLPLRLTGYNIGGNPTIATFEFPEEIQAGTYLITYRLDSGPNITNTIGTFSAPTTVGLFANANLPAGAFFSGFTTYQSPFPGEDCSTCTFAFYLNLTGAYSNPIPGAAGAQSRAMFSISYTTTGGTDLPGTPNTGEITCQQVSPGLIGALGP